MTLQNFNDIKFQRDIEVSSAIVGQKSKCVMNTNNINNRGNYRPILHEHQFQ